MLLHCLQKSSPSGSRQWKLVVRDPPCRMTKEGTLKICLILINTVVHNHEATKQTGGHSFFVFLHNH